MKRPALQNKQDVLLRMAFRARKVLGTFEKRAPDIEMFFQKPEISRDVNMMQKIITYIQTKKI